MISMISRRKLITTAAATGAASMLLHASGTGKATRQVDCEVESRGPIHGLISIVVPTDPKFSSLLNTHFPGLAHDAQFRKIQSNAVLITNISGKDINAFSSFWEVDTPTGGYEVALRHFFHPSEKRQRTVHFGTQGNQTRFTGQIPAIRAGATRLLSPYFNWSSNYYQRNVKPDWTKILARGARSTFAHTELSSATSIRVTLDAVIVNQSQVIGPDRAHLAKTYMMMRNAEHDAAAGVINMVACEDDSVSQILNNHNLILNYLVSSGEKYTPSSGDAFKDRLYRKVRQRQATILARRFQHATPAQFLRTLQYLAAQPKTIIHPVSLT
jgi:hypothetical protein